MIDPERLVLEGERRRGARVARGNPVRAARFATRYLASAAVRSLAGDDGADRNALLAKAYAEGVCSTLTAQNRCLRCGRSLTDQASMDRQIGADCLAKFGGDEGWAEWRQTLGLGVTS